MMLSKYKVIEEQGRRITTSDIAYSQCFACSFNTLAVLEQGYSFVVYLCDCCGAKVERAL